MMHTIAAVLLLTAAFPLWRAWQANRTTSLRHTLVWAMLAWMVWLWALFGAAQVGAGAIAAPYLAVCMTSCAIVGVLGARRPGMSAWNFVVGGLLAVALLPLAESLIASGTLRIPMHWTVLMAAIVGMGVINYLPTRLGPAAVMIAVASGVEMLTLVTAQEVGERWSRVAPVSRCLLAFAPWAAFFYVRSPSPSASAFDRIWLDFRDRLGLIWAQRLREQFNRSATNAGWPLHLYWRGLRAVRVGDQALAPETAVIMGTLLALMKRFGISGN